MNRQLGILLAFLVIFTGILPLSAAEKTGPAKESATPLTHGGYRLFQPVWSPDGKYLAMTSDNYRGIWVMDLKSYNIVPLTDEERVGYGLEWSSDSREIACRTVKTTKKRLSAIKVFEVETGMSRLVTDFRPHIGLPFWANRDLHICYTADKKFEIVSTERAVRPADARNGFYDKEEIVLFNSFGRVVVSNLDQTRQTVLVDPVNRFINPQLSPARNKIVIEMTNGHIFVMNIDGTDVTDLGPGSAPRWAPSGELIAYFISEDDGERIISSDIFVSDLTGEKKTQLTNTQDRIEMHPDWAPDGNSIVFDEYDTGLIYQIKLKPDPERKKSE